MDFSVRAGGFRPVVRGTFEQFKTRLLRVVGRGRLGGEGSIRLRRPPCCPRCLLRARAAVRIAPERRAHEFRPSDYEKGTRHPSINPIGGEEKPPVRPLETVAGRCKYNLRIEAE